MDFTNVIEGKDINKKYKGFELDIKDLRIPRGFATALIGENGAGKTTLLNILAGIRLDYSGKITYFDRYTDDDRNDKPDVKEMIGYTGTDNYFLPHWTIDQFADLSGLLFKNFDEKKFKTLYDELAISSSGRYEGNKKISELSDGTKTKLALAGVLARDTEMLIMDEPASPLDPLMRDKLCELIREYISENENHSVFFSTHNISDMENVTDYAIIMEHGQIMEAGFVDELKEKYILVKGEKEDSAAAKNILYTMSESKYGFEGICLSQNLDKLAGMDVTTETASLFQISVAIMKNNTRVK